MIEKSGKRIVASITECLTAEQVADQEFMKRFLDERIPDSHRGESPKKEEIST